MMRFRAFIALVLAALIPSFIPTVGWAALRPERLLCQALLKGHDPHRRSLMVTEGMEPREGGRLLNNWHRWSLEDFKHLAGKVFNFADRSPRQEILFPTDFDALEQVLIARLLELSRVTKYTDRVSPKEFGTVEIGAWRVELKSGEIVTATHTSSEEGGILMADAAAAMNGMLARRKIDPHRIVQAQYFHSHARTPLLSEGDGIFLVFMKRALLQSGVNVPVHIYATLKVDGETVVSHKGLR